MLLLVDGHALLHRAFHAIPPLTTSKGELTNAVFGFATMLFKAIAELKPDQVAVAFDRHGPTFRHNEYAEYKATRPPAPEGLHEQLDRVRELVAALGYPIYELDGYEADDVLGALARQATAKGIPVVVATGDADAMQLVSPSVRVMVPMRGFSETTTYDEAGVKQRYGVAPAQIPDFKALKGDTSDNIKGVPGIGEKTAVRLLEQFGSIEELIARSAELPPKLRPLIEEHAKEALKDKWLATIDRDAPVELQLVGGEAGGYDRPRLVGLLRELEFNSLLRKLPEQRSALAVSAPPAATQQLDLFADAAPGAFDATSRPLVLPQAASVGRDLGDYRIVDTVEALGELVQRIVRRARVSVDVETTGTDAMRASLVGISLAVEPGSAYYIPVGHRTDSQQLPLARVASALGPALADPSIAKIGHNLKYDLLVLRRHGLPLAGIAFDTMLATYLLESSQRALNLKDVAFARLGIEMTQITDLIGKGKAQITMADVPVEAAAKYAAADADMALRLSEKLGPELRATPGLWDLFAQIEVPLVEVLADIEEAGVALDVDYLKKMSGELASRIGDLEASIYAEAGHRFNINSTQQLAQVLFDELHLAPSRRTKTGQSTDAETLEALRGDHPIVGLILDHRQLIKLKSTYVDALPLMINPATGRVHTSFNQTGAATGRVSSSDPNLQNIPTRTEIGREVRRAFVAAPGNCLFGADYSQIELRILAHVTRDAGLVAAFAADEDIHAATASQLFGVDLRAVTSEQRRMAKTTNFGVIYGISGFGLAQRLQIPRKEADAFIQQYFQKYPTIRGYLQQARDQAQDHGYVTTLIGRRRYIPDIHAPNQAIRNAAERMAINMPIQGTAADIIKVAMIRVHRKLKQRGLRSRMILQVHDELVFEGPDEELGDLRGLVVEAMEHAPFTDAPIVGDAGESGLKLSVPLKVEVKSGKNWRDLE